MNGVLRTALQFYTRTRTQRGLMAVALLLIALELLAPRQLCRATHGFCGWALLAGPATGVGTAFVAWCAWDFRRISALRTVSLIPYARLQLVGGLLLAQVFAAAVGTGLVLLAVQGQLPEAPAWGSAHGTFEMLIGCLLSLIVLMQVISGPSRLLSASCAVLVAWLSVRVDLFMHPTLLGRPTADVVVLAGLLAWLSFAVWYVRAWRPVAPFAAWRRGGATRSVPFHEVSRQRALQALLLGEPTLLRACRQSLLVWMGYHVVCLVLMAGMGLTVRSRHPLPLNFSLPLMILLYAPVIAVHKVASRVSQGSRRLWLRGGVPRTALYGIAARLAWQCLGWIAIPLFGLVLLESRLLPHRAFDIGYPLALWAAASPCALYLGLRNFRKPFDPAFMALFLTAGTAMMAHILTESTVEMLWAVPPALCVLAIVLRTLARRRWAAIDWLEFRAERAPPGAWGGA